MTLKKWQIAEVKKLLGIAKSKKRPGESAITLVNRFEFSEEKLSEPVALLSKISRKLQGGIDRAQGQLTVLLNSQTKAEWLRLKDNYSS